MKRLILNRRTILFTAALLILSTLFGVGSFRPAVVAADTTGGSSSNPSTDTATQTEGDGTEVSATHASIPLNIVTCVDTALAHDPDLRLAEIGLERARIALEKARDADKSFRELRRFLPASEAPPFSFETAVAEKTSLKMAKNGIAYAEKGIELKRLALKSEVEKAFFDVLKNQKLVESSHLALDRANDQLEQARSRFDLGLVPKSDVLSAQVQAASSMAALSCAQQALEMSYMTLNKYLGTPMYSRPTLDGTMEYEPFSADLPESIKTAIENRLEIKQAMDSLAVAREEFEVAKAYYTPNVYVYQQKELEVKEAEITLEKATENVEFSVRAAYSALKIAEAKLKVYDESIQQAAESLKLASLLYQEGLGTISQVLSAQTALAQTDVQRLTALFDYNVAKAQFLNALGQK